jgi:uncharacterized protein (DUF4213/DUF364 family)
MRRREGGGQVPSVEATAVGNGPHPVATAVDRLLEGIRSDARARQIVVGVFWTAVVLDGDPPRCGLASSVVGPHSHSAEEPPIVQPGHLLGQSAKELAEKLRSASSLEASVGMAAFNALLDVREDRCRGANAESLILEAGSGRDVAVVGHFPFVDRVRRQARECWVLELTPQPGDVPAEHASEILPHADVVALSGTTLINHTFDALIELCRPDAFVVLVGASAPLSPVLFECGVDAICGTRVLAVEDAVRAISQGATFRQIPGRRPLTLLKPPLA